MIAAAQCATLNGELDKVVTWVAARLCHPHHPIAGEVPVFERFTDRARQVTVFAQYEAVELRHSEVDTEHLLLGLARERDGVAATALASLGVDLDTARAWVAEAHPPDPPDEGIPVEKLRFAPRAKKVLELSLREALQLGHNYIGTEHILLGLVRETDGTAVRILAEHDLSASEVRQAVIDLLSGNMPPRTGVSVVGSESRFVRFSHMIRTAAVGSRGTDEPGEPGCPRCPAGFPGNLRSRRARLAGLPGPVTLLYCARCGATTAVLPAGEGQAEGQVEDQDDTGGELQAEAG